VVRYMYVTGLGSSFVSRGRNACGYPLSQPAGVPQPATGSFVGAALTAAGGADEGREVVSHADITGRR
jgi:hypothetical protein